MSYMFWYAAEFNSPLDSWDTGALEYTGSMFDNALKFNQPLDSWQVASVTDMYEMFNQAHKFTQPLNSWETDGATNRDTSDIFAYSGCDGGPTNRVWQDGRSTSDQQGCQVRQ